MFFHWVIALLVEGTIKDPASLGTVVRPTTVQKITMKQYGITCVKKGKIFNRQYRLRKMNIFFFQKIFSNFQKRSFLFTFLFTKPLLLRGVLTKERVCSSGTNPIFKSRQLLTKETPYLNRVTSLVRVSIPLLFPTTGTCQKLSDGGNYNVLPFSILLVSAALYTTGKKNRTCKI